MMHKHARSGIWTLLAFAAVGIVGIVFAASTLASSAPVSEKEESKKTLDQPNVIYSKNLLQHHPPPSLLSDLYGATFPSVAAARQASGLDVKVPSYTPSNLDMKVVKARIEPDNQVKMVTLIYVPKQFEINDNTTAEDVLDHSGLIAIYTKMLPGFDAAKWVDQYAKNTPSSQLTTVHGANAIAFEGDPAAGKRSQIIFYDGDIQVILLSLAYQKAELMKIAESMP